eukprot:3656493-Rhodomonas_salina.1
MSFIMVFFVDTCVRARVRGHVGRRLSHVHREDTEERAVCVCLAPGHVTSVSVCLSLSLSLLRADLIDLRRVLDVLGPARVVQRAAPIDPVSARQTETETETESQSCTSASPTRQRRTRCAMLC